MPMRARVVEQAARDASRRLADQLDELRRARRMAGLSQAAVARALGVSASSMSRAERGTSRRLSMQLLAGWAAAVGLVVRVSFYPLASPIRDAPQLALIGRLQPRLHGTWQITLEAPVQIPGDLRAADLLLAIPGCTIAVEAVTRLRDIQAQVRAGLLKQRDLEATRLILLVSDTQPNRLALRTASHALAGAFPLRTRGALLALGEGRDPGANAIIVL
jgi:transcriptional regulator with XRE-family HTH domain